MKNNNNLIGTALLVLLIAALFYFMTKNKDAKKPQADKAKTEQTKAATADSTASAAPSATIVTDTTAIQSKYGTFAAASANPSKEIVIENELMKVTFSTKGGMVKKVELKKYLTWDKKPLILFDEKSQELNYEFAVNNTTTLNSNDVNFSTNAESGKITGNEKKDIVFYLKSNDNSYIEQKYSISGDSYVIDYDINFVGLGNLLPKNLNAIDLNLKSKLASLEQEVPNERRFSAIYYKMPNKSIEHTDEDKENVEENINNAPIDILGFKRQFFTMAILAKSELRLGKLNSNYDRKDKSYNKIFVAKMTLPYSPEKGMNAKMQFYFGPNEYYTLQSTADGFEGVIKLSPDNFLFHWIKYLNKWLFMPVFKVLSKLNLNYGIIIILLTLLLKILLTPLTWKTIKTQAYTKALKPEIEQLKEKYGDDQTTFGQKQMELYRKAGVNQFGGCLPMLLQIPIMMSLYYFFLNTIELRQQPFLWAKDLTSYDAVITFNTAIPLLGNHLSLFTILLTITSIAMAVYQQRSSGQVVTQPGMQYMPYIMPVMLMFMFNSFPAALTFYYLVQNLLSMAQQWIMEYFFIDNKKVRAEIEHNFKNPAPKSGWAKKMEEIQRQAEQQQKARNKKKG